MNTSSRRRSHQTEIRLTFQKLNIDIFRRKTIKQELPEGNQGGRIELVVWQYLEYMWSALINPGTSNRNSFLVTTWESKRRENGKSKWEQSLKVKQGKV